MLNTVWAVVQNGKIETLSAVEAPKGTRALVTLLVEDEADFWQAASSTALDAIWKIRTTKFMPNYLKLDYV